MPDNPWDTHIIELGLEYKKARLELDNILDSLEYMHKIVLAGEADPAFGRDIEALLAKEGRM